MIKLSNFLNPHKDLDEHKVNFDNPGSWQWKDAMHLVDMGFECYEHASRFKLTEKNADATLNVEIYKKKSTGEYIMELNGRKHTFRTFDEMINFIDTRNQEN
jgi:hypothetical protein